MFPQTRMRRLRRTAQLRNLVREVRLSVDDYIYPIFVIEGNDIVQPVPSMPGVHQFSLDHLPDELDRAYRAGIRTVMFFGIPIEKDPVGLQAYDDNGIIQEAIRLTRNRYEDVLIATDVCLCEYTSHGHCGVIEDGYVQNDPTLSLLVKVAVSHAAAGADILAPSDMMDGRIGLLRAALDDAGYKHVVLMSHAAKYASSFYGPFRDAAGSTPQFGDRKTYQMDPASGARQALAELALDVEEGADMLIIKPGLAYLDLIRQANDTFTQPIVAYNVSGEYAMVKAAAQNGWIDEQAVVLEMMTAFKRAGADCVITYHAIDIAHWLNDQA